MCVYEIKTQLNWNTGDKMVEQPTEFATLRALILRELLRSSSLRTYIFSTRRNSKIFGICFPILNRLNIDNAGVEGSLRLMLAASSLTQGEKRADRALIEQLGNGGTEPAG